PVEIAPSRRSIRQNGSFSSPVAPAHVPPRRRIRTLRTGILEELVRRPRVTPRGPLTARPRGARRGSTSTSRLSRARPPPLWRALRRGFRRRDEGDGAGARDRDRPTRTLRSRGTWRPRGPAPGSAADTRFLRERTRCALPNLLRS